MRLLPTSRWCALIIKAVTVSSRPHLQLRQAALCLDCEECFELGTAACPACGSKTWTLLVRVLTRPMCRSIKPVSASQGDSVTLLGSVREADALPRGVVESREGLRKGQRPPSTSARSEGPVALEADSDPLRV